MLINNSIYSVFAKTVCQIQNSSFMNFTIMTVTDKNSFWFACFAKVSNPKNAILGTTRDTTINHKQCHF